MNRSSIQSDCSSRTSRCSRGNHCSVLVFCPKHKHSQYSRSLAKQFILKCNRLSIHSDPLITWLPTLLIALHYVTPLRAAASPLRRQQLYVERLSFVFQGMFYFLNIALLPSHSIIYSLKKKFSFCFLGAFAKLQIVTTGFFMSVSLSAWKSASIGQIFMKFEIWIFF